MSPGNSSSATCFARAPTRAASLGESHAFLRRIAYRSISCAPLCGRLVVGSIDVSSAPRKPGRLGGKLSGRSGGEVDLEGGIAPRAVARVLDEVVGRLLGRAGVVGRLGVVLDRELDRLRRLVAGLARDDVESHVD